MLIRWIVIYPVDSAIHLLNNRGLVSRMLSIATVQSDTTSYTQARLPRILTTWSSGSHFLTCFLRHLMIFSPRRFLRHFLISFLLHFCGKNKKNINHFIEIQMHSTEDKFPLVSSAKSPVRPNFEILVLVEVRKLITQRKPLRQSDIQHQT